MSLRPVVAIPALVFLASAAATAQIDLVTLHEFNAADGAHPLAALVQAGNGEFYGTTLRGGPSGKTGYGTIFEISASGALTTLYAFCSQGEPCTDGANPQAGLIQASDGNFYGTTYGGEVRTDYGTVFRITPNGVLTTLYRFCSQHPCADGLNPTAGLVQGADGNFYGTTFYGGERGYGTVFKITPSGMLTTLHSFGTETGQPDGANPVAGLVQASNGDFYGTTDSGGAADSGTIFKISSDGTLTTLYSFCARSGCPDGGSPYGSLIQASDGNLYGTTRGLKKSNGTVFKITPRGALTTLYRFCSEGPPCADGLELNAGLVQASDGNFYGTTGLSGGHGGGTIFRITPGGTLTTLYAFCSQSGCADGKSPYGGLIQDSDGSLYGTTRYGGANGGIEGYGTIFRLSLGLPPSQ